MIKMEKILGLKIPHSYQFSKISRPLNVENAVCLLNMLLVLYLETLKLLIPGELQYKFIKLMKQWKELLLKTLQLLVFPIQMLIVLLLMEPLNH